MVIRRPHYTSAVSTPVSSFDDILGYEVQPHASKYLIYIGFYFWSKGINPTVNP